MDFFVVLLIILLAVLVGGSVAVCYYIYNSAQVTDLSAITANRLSSPLIITDGDNGPVFGELLGYILTDQDLHGLFMIGSWVRNMSVSNSSAPLYVVLPAVPLKLRTITFKAELSNPNIVNVAGVILEPASSKKMAFVAADQEGKPLEPREYITNADLPATISPGNIEMAVMYITAT